MQWAQKQRLRYIEERLLWEGRVNRADIMTKFGVSAVQASTDLRSYREKHPGNAVYDHQLKAYRPSDHFTPGLITPCSGRLLQELSFIGGAAEQMPLPGRGVDPEILRPILQAVTDGTHVCILYQSLTRPAPTFRTIRPHTFVSDGLRWHVRGYCGLAGGYRDFLLARVLEVSTGDPALALPGLGEDHCWHQEIHLELAPHPGLTPDQQAVIASDYGMEGGKTIFSVRQAYLPYLLRRLGLLRETDNAREQQLTILNREAVDRWYREVVTPQTNGEGA